jgi:CheY-like chemotaxis protein
MPAPSFEVLIVEDDRVQRHLYEQVLAKMGPDVHLRSATTGIEGLIRIGERQPNVLITDLMMPGVDGFEMLEALRTGTLVQPMQIIVATGMDEDELRERGGLPPGITVFHKPVPLPKLVRLVEAYRDIWAIQENDS